MQSPIVKQNIIELIAKQTGLDSDTIESEMTFEEDLGLTDDDLLSLLKQLNRHFEEINLNLDDLVENGVNTVGDLIQLVSDELAFS